MVKTPLVIIIVVSKVVSVLQHLSPPRVKGSVKNREERDWKRRILGTFLETGFGGPPL